MINHMVLLKFSMDTSKAQIDELIINMKRLEGSVKGLLEIQIGNNISDRNQDFQVGMIMRFHDKAAMQCLRDHPRHKELVSYAKDIGLVDQNIVDFEIK